MSSRFTILLPLVTAAAVAAQEPYNQTAVRERLETIVTIDGDLRRDGVYTASAMPWPEWWGDVRIGYQSSAVAWENGSPVAQAQANPPPGDEKLRERRQELDLRWRQNLGTPWLSLETVVHGVKEDRTDDSYHLGDIETNFVLPVFLDRYQAVALAFGVLSPVLDDGKDWISSHGSIKDSGWTGRVEVRGSFGIELATLQVRAVGLYTPHGTNELPGIDDSVKDTYLAFEGAVGLTYRFTRWLRAGAEQAYANQTWKSRDEPTDFTTRMISGPLIGTVEFTPDPGSGLYVQAYAGSDLANRGELSDRDRMIVGGQVMFVY